MTRQATWPATCLASLVAALSRGGRRPGAQVVGASGGQRGFNEVAARGLPLAPAAQLIQREGAAAVDELMGRAREAGVLRADVTLADLAFVIWGISRTVDMTADRAPELWRRHLALLLDGFRAEGASPLPGPPLAPGPSHHAAPPPG